MNSIRSRLAALKGARHTAKLESMCFDELDEFSKSMVEYAVELANLNTQEKKSAYLEAHPGLSLEVLEKEIQQFVYDFDIPLAWTKRKDGSSIVKPS